MSHAVQQIDDVIEPIGHVATCFRCRQRWARDVQVAGLHARSDTDEEHAEAAGSLPVKGIWYTCMLSPLGLLWVAAGSRGLLRVSSFTDEVSFCFELESSLGRAPRAMSRGLSWVVRQFDQYFAGQRVSFDLPLDLKGMTPFQRAALEAVKDVPYGAVASYGEIASRVGKPGAARAVGAAVAANPLSIVIPCHRVVRSDGTLGEYAYRTLGACGPHFKQQLLALEGVLLPL